MKDMIETTLKHIFQRWVKNYTMAHLKLREPRKLGCITHIKEL